MDKYVKWPTQEPTNIFSVGDCQFLNFCVRNALEYEKAGLLPEAYWCIQGFFNCRMEGDIHSSSAAGYAAKLQQRWPRDWGQWREWEAAKKVTE